MFPVVSPGGIDPGLARRLESADVSAPVGVQPVTLDPHAPRAMSPPVSAMQAQGVRVQAEPLAPPDPTGARRQLAEDQLLATAGANVNRAALVAPQLLLLLQSLQQLGLVDGDPASAAMVAWPAADQPVAPTPAQALQTLRDTLGRSPLFAANPRTAAALAAGPWRASHHASSGASQLPGTHDPSSTLRAASTMPPAAGFVDLASTMAADGPGIDSTQQALQLLLHGQLQWSGELTPGVKARLRREDAWQEDPQRPGRLLQGSALRVELDLPATGPLVVLAQQVGAQLSVRVLPGPGQALRFEAELADLRTALEPLSDTPVDLALHAPGLGGQPDGIEARS